jgi:hypothetical protein
MLDKIIYDELVWMCVCVCVYYEFYLRNIFFLTITREYTISCKKSRYARKFMATHRLRDTDVHRSWRLITPLRFHALILFLVLTEKKQSAEKKYSVNHGFAWIRDGGNKLDCC